MTVTWEKFAGNTDVFAVRAAFMPDPHDGHAADPEESASWGTLQIWVNGHNLCAHIDQGELLQNVHWYLLPLLEWFVDNWNPVLHEERLPNTNSGERAVTALALTRNAPALAGEAETVAWEQEWFGWWGRHSLRAARSGGLVPNVVMRRFRDLVEISWDDEPAAGTPRGFSYSATNGIALLAPDAVARPLYELVKAAVDYLGATGSAGPRTKALGRRLSTLTGAQQHDNRLDWLAGLRELPPLSGRLSGADPELEMHTRWSEIVAALQDMDDSAAARGALEVDESALVISGSCHATLLFSSLSPTVTKSDVRTFAAILVDRFSTDRAPTPLDELARQIPIDANAPPWEQGYDLAETAHEELGIDLRAGWVDIEGLLSKLGVALQARELGDRGIRACSVVGLHHRPLIVQNARSSFLAR